MLNMVLKSAVRADFREELSSAWFLPLECVEAGERRGHFKWFKARCLFGDGPEVRPAGWNGSLEGKPGRMGYGWSLENLEFPVQNFKTYPRSNKKLWSFGSRLERNYGAGNFMVERDQLGTGPGVFQLCSTDAPRL